MNNLFYPDNNVFIVEPHAVLETERVVLNFVGLDTAQNFKTLGNGTYTVDGKSITIFNQAASTEFQTTPGPTVRLLLDGNTGDLYSNTRSAARFEWNFNTSLSRPLESGDICEAVLEYDDFTMSGITGFPQLALYSLPLGQDHASVPTLFATALAGGNPTTDLSLVTRLFPANVAADIAMATGVSIGSAASVSPLGHKWLPSPAGAFTGGGFITAETSAIKNIVAAPAGIVGVAAKLGPQLGIKSLSVRVYRNPWRGQQ